MKKMDKKAFSERINGLLKIQGLCKADLARAVGCHESSISRYCDGTSVPQAKMLVRIASALGTTVNYLITGTTDTVPADKVDKVDTIDLANVEYVEDVEDVDGGEDVNDEIYVLSPWGCLAGVLMEYGIDTSHISGRVGTHIVEDFMDAMVKAGHVAKSEG